VEGGAGGAEGEGDDIAGGVVVLNERGERKVGEDVAVVNEEGVGAVEEVADIGDAAGGLEPFGGFVAEVEGSAVVAGVGEGEGEGPGEVVGIDDDGAGPGGDDVVEGGADEGPVVEGDEGFGQLGGQGAQALPEAGAQNKSLVHGADLRSPWVGRKRKFANDWRAGPGAAPLQRVFGMTETERRILAAQGYVELSLHVEARAVLEGLPEEAGDRVDVQEILLLCLMAEARWEEALALTLRLCELEPEEPGGFIHAAFCLHELGRTEEAVDMLSRGPTALRSKPVYYYNMGCYHARLGDMERALKLLRQSFEMDGSLRQVARKDPDLDVLRPEIQRL
jgi:hypothetical protein